MIVFDVEADGLLDQATKIHCLSYTDDGNNYKTLQPDQVVRQLLHQIQSCCYVTPFVWNFFT